jgi:hypothetical protein
LGFCYDFGFELGTLNKPLLLEEESSIKIRKYIAVTYQNYRLIDIRKLPISSVNSVSGKASLL